MSPSNQPHNSLSTLYQVPLRPQQPIKQRPRQHEPTSPPKQIPQPQLPQRAIKELLTPALGLEHKQQQRDQQRAGQVEGEAGVGLEAQGAGGDAEERGGERADVGCDLGVLEW